MEPVLRVATAFPQTLVLARVRRRPARVAVTGQELLPWRGVPVDVPCRVSRRDAPGSDAAKPPRNRFPRGSLSSCGSGRAYQGGNPRLQNGGQLVNLPFCQSVTASFGKSSSRHSGRIALRREGSRDGRMGGIAVPDDYHERAETGADRPVQARRQRHRLRRGTDRHSDDPDQRIDGTPADSQEGFRGSTRSADAGQSSSSLVGLPQEGGSTALSERDSAARDPQVVGGASMAGTCIAGEGRNEIERTC